MAEMTDALLDPSILDELERRLGRERLCKVLAVQLSNGRDLGQRLAALEGTLDRMQLRALAHQMAGSSGSIGLVGLSRQAKALENAALGEPDDEIRSLIVGLRASLDQSQQALGARYPELPPA